MPIEPVTPTNFNKDNRKNLENGNQQGAIDRVYELLSLGHSVGEILNTISSIRRDSECHSPASEEDTRAGFNDAAAELRPRVGSPSAAQANTRWNPIPSLSDNEKIKMTGKLRAAEISPLDDVSPGNRQQACHDGLSRYQPEISKSAGTHRSTAPEISLHCRDEEQLHSGKFPRISQRIKIVVLYMVAIASASIVCASISSILHREHDGKSFVIPVHSDASRSIEAKTNPYVAVERSDAIEEALNLTMGILNAYFLLFRKASHADDRHLAAPNSQSVEAAGQEKNFVPWREPEPFQMAGTGQSDTTKRSNLLMRASPDLADQPTPLVPKTFFPAPVKLAAEVPHVDAAHLRATPSHTGETSEATGAIRPELTRQSQAESATPTQTATTRDASEPAQIRMNKSKFDTTPTLSISTAIKLGAEASVASSATETEHEHEVGRGDTGAAQLAESARTEQPDAARPTAHVAAVPGPVPRIVEITSEDLRFKTMAADVLVARGDTFFAAGDLVSARLFYEHAAAAGNDIAALRLGGTFDPSFLARARIGRVQGDAAIALYWYRRSRDLGNGDAEILLKKMEKPAR